MVVDVRFPFAPLLSRAYMCTSLTEPRLLLFKSHVEFLAVSARGVVVLHELCFGADCLTWARPELVLTSLFMHCNLSATGCCLDRAGHVMLCSSAGDVCTQPLR
jgi:hypothetical protein